MKQLMIHDNNTLVKEIAIFWHIEDVRSIRSDLTDEQASIVLQSIKKNHQADVGINWDVIEVVADIIFPEVKTTSKEGL